MFELDNSGRLMKLLFSYHAFVSLLCLRSTLRLLPYTRIEHIIADIYSQVSEETI